MLEALRFRDAGPAPRLEITFKERLNFLAGDNGLGKSFLLDAAWWALTRTWARSMITPLRPPSNPEIGYRYGTKSGKSHSYTSKFDRDRERWLIKQGRPSIPGLVLYGQVDGGFSVWDPARNYWKGETSDRPPAYLFTPQEVWEGVPINQSTKASNGLIADWANWQLENGETFQQLRSVLTTLAPSRNESLEPGDLTKISLADARRHPTIKMPYGQDVPLVHASAGIRRIVTLAYLLVWTWQEHKAACDLLGEVPAKEIIFLIDEIEAHLHPQWQRRVVPALLRVMETLTGVHSAKVQLIAATHSPLVLAAVEPYFDEDRDGIFHLDLLDGVVRLQEQPWAKQGDVVNWLVSDTFGLKQGRSIEAEQAIEAAEAWMRADQAALPPNLTTKEAIHEELLRVLAGHDPFWPRWIVWTEKQAAGG
jgi:hypothetical protein